MCGIVGVIAGNSLAFSDSQLSLMADRITHRGPDSHGTWSENGAYLGHRRLSIVDLSSAGHQPMISHNQRYVLTYNGEIYNHADIRKALDGNVPINWRGHSDTETLLEALSRWGVDKTLEKINGMFAFGLWDRQTRTLVLARDPFGEKPLLYSVMGDALVFASELTAIRTIPGFKGQPDAAAVSCYLQNWNVPAPMTVMKGVMKLPPGSVLSWKANSDPHIKSYWSLSDVAAKGRGNLINNEHEALDELQALLLDSVKMRMAADVPLGALLSGGVDSSLIVALMQQCESNPVRTFTIGFEQSGIDETVHAEAVASHLGTKHETMVLTDDEALKAVPLMGSVYDEPFGDASQVPTYLVSALARRHVTVALTGDGFDELFSGYARHTLAPVAWKAIDRIPLRKWLGPKIESLPQPVLNLMSSVLKPMIPKGVNSDSLKQKLRTSGSMLGLSSIEELYDTYLSSWLNPSELLLNSVAPAQKQLPNKPKFSNSHDQFVWQDGVDYLPNDILTKVDRASMAVSLETRIPALDRRLAEFAWRLPQDMRWRDGMGKWSLRQVLHRLVPKELVERPKKGFAVPLEHWLRGPLKAWSHDLLSTSRLKRQGLLNPDVIETKLQSFERGGSVQAGQIWTILMLQSWMEANGL